MKENLKMKDLCDKVIIIAQLVLAMGLLGFSIYTKSMFIIATLLIFVISVIRFYMCTYKHYYRKYLKHNTDDEIKSYIEFKESVKNEDKQKVTIKKKIFNIFLKVITVVVTLIFFGISSLFIIDEMYLSKISDIEKDIENTYYVDVDIVGYNPEDNYIENFSNGMRGFLSYRVIDGTRDVLKIFPDGFFEEYSDKNIMCQKLNIVFFNDSIEVDGMMDEYTGLCVYEGTIYLRMDIFDNKYVASHEIFHAMECQIAYNNFNDEVCEEFNGWNDFNPIGFEYPLNYTYGQDIENNISTKYTVYDENHNNGLYFVTPYSTVCEMEDRADLFMYSTGLYDDEYFRLVVKSGHIRDKYEKIFEVIDEFYDSIDENSTWETYYRKSLSEQ